ncbi:diguanylate cyclase [Thalassotalea sp. LPB0316]|uniref:GGDEF domain-containing response regulator n=1 Tax=Thalassotalea sp. LPB0316 TaxID=2769490 RepID=UPI001D04A3AB|nr:diguanylate cyclase [Thalassotalea sp. LPB0316]
MADKATILVVDDTKQNIDILLGLLDGYDLLVALDGDSAIEIAQQEPIDLILLDIIMPGMDGIEVCKQLKSHEETKHIPVIFITAKTDEETIELAYDSGGLDFVTKPFKPKELLARIKTQLKLQALIKHLDNLSSFDQMTGIYNRRKFFELAEQQFAQAAENLCAMMIDIDKFKPINDNYGHPTGDRVIKAVAKTIKELLPQGAVVGRLGGEEFAVILTATWQEACQLIEKMRIDVAELALKSDDDCAINVTISGGLVKSNESYRSLDHLLKAADDALYEAKGTGRNKAVLRS